LDLLRLAGYQRQLQMVVLVDQPRGRYEVRVMHSVRDLLKGHPAGREPARINGDVIFSDVAALHRDPGDARQPRQPRPYSISGKVTEAGQIPAVGYKAVSGYWKYCKCKALYAAYLCGRGQR